MSTIIDKIKKLDQRLSWDEYFMSVTYLISKRSSCNKLHVGCVIVNDRRIVTTGYNGHIKGAPHTSEIVDGHEQMTIHAEANAITDAASRGVKIFGSTAYVTHYPCINCSKILIAAGIKEIIYGEDYNNNPLCAKLFDLGKVLISKLSIENDYITIDIEDEKYKQDYQRSIII